MNSNFNTSNKSNYNKKDPEKYSLQNKSKLENKNTEEKKAVYENNESNFNEETENDNLMNKNNKNILSSDLRQITEEESIKKSVSIKPKKDYFNWDHYAKYVLNRRNKLSSIEEEQEKLAKLPGSGNIWKSQLTIPGDLNLKTNKNYLNDNYLHYNNKISLNKSINNGSEICNYFNTQKLYQNENSYNDYYENHKVKNVKVMKNF